MLPEDTVAMAVAEVVLGGCSNATSATMISTRPASNLPQVIVADNLLRRFYCSSIPFALPLSLQVVRQSQTRTRKANSRYLKRGSKNVSSFSQVSAR